MFQAFVSLIPLIVILVLLARKVNMILAGLVGGMVAMVIAGVSIGAATGILLDTLPKMLGIIVPIINSAIAFAVFHSGGYTAALTLMKRSVGDRAELFAVFIIFLTGIATYVSGFGGGTVVILAPLAFAAFGVIPEVIAGMSIAAAVSFTTSPASLETGIYAKLTGVNPVEYVSFMQPFWMFFFALALIIGYYGAKKRGAIFKEDVSTGQDEMTDAQLWKTTIPAIFLMIAVMAGPSINKMAGFPIFSPLVYTMVTIIMIGIFTKMNMNQAFNALVDGSSFILTRLFGVGIFLSFIYIVEKAGAFATIASIAQLAPTSLTNPAAVLAGFLIGAPAGAYVGTVLAMILPVAMALKMTPMAMGFAVMGVGLGSQVSFVNITMQAHSAGFQIPVEQVSKGNAPWVGGCLVLLMGCAILFA